MMDYLKGFLLSLVVVISPILESIYAVCFLIFVDLIFKLLAVRKEGGKFEFVKLESTGIKTLIYNMLLVVCFVSEQYLVNFIPLVKVCLSFIVYLELNSISKSFETLTGLSFIKFLRTWVKDQIHKKTPK